MDVRFFTTFLEVSKTRHFGKAAENLYLTPAAVSARIKQLEEYFNAILFTRERNSIQLTQAGEKLLPFAQQMVASLKQARQLLSEQDAAFLTCGATSNAASLVLDELFEACKSHFTEIAVSTEIHCTEQLSRLLHERTIDFAFTTEPLKSADIETISIRQEALFFLAQPPTTENLETNDFVQIDWSSKATAALLTTHPRCKHYQFRTNDAQAAIRYINQYGGSLVLPKLLHPLLKNIDDLQQHNVGSVALYCARLKERPHPIAEQMLAFLDNTDK